VAYKKSFFYNFLSSNKNLKKINYKYLDSCVKDAVKKLNKMLILTNSSEGGGDNSHSAPDFAYIEAKLSKYNLNVCKKNNFLLDKIYGKNGQKDLLFNGSAIKYGEKTGFYVIGFNRKNIPNNVVKQKFKEIISKLRPQKDKSYLQ